MAEKFEGWPTTRCYPRTLDEAFPNDRMGEWFEPHVPATPTWHDITLYVVTVLVFVVLVKVVGG